jgi:hypothetical protein
LLVLLVRAKQKQRANSDRVMRVDEDRCRCATAAYFFQNFAVGHLRETASAIFLRRGHTEHADAPKAINHLAGNICLSIDLSRIEMFIEKLAKFAERLVQLDLLRGRDTRIRHHPIGDEVALEKPFGETQRLRPGKKQFLSLLNFFLSLRVESNL